MQSTKVHICHWHILWRKRTWQSKLFDWFCEWI